jgi:hypothetical protein
VGKDKVDNLSVLTSPGGIVSVGSGSTRVVDLLIFRSRHFGSRELEHWACVTQIVPIS